MKNTLRLVLPQWQGGVNPDYVFGAELLSCIVPPSKMDETMRVAVHTDFDRPLESENGVAGEGILLAQLEETSSILENKQPDRVIVLGGDCSISQAPFDYLSGRYGEKLGILWLDAHPDISTPHDTTHAHEMVLGNIIGHGAPRFAARMKHPVDSKRVMYAGLIEEELRPMDQAVHTLGIRAATPAALATQSGPIVDWIRGHGIGKLAVHFDLDVLSPDDFRSILPAKPYQSREAFGAAIGTLTLDQVVRILQDAGAHAELVGLCIAEHMPWDAMNLRRALGKLSIFQDE